MLMPAVLPLDERAMWFLGARARFELALPGCSAPSLWLDWSSRVSVFG